MLVRGMPQAVNAYMDTNDLSAVNQAKRGIINIYMEDFQIDFLLSHGAKLWSLEVKPSGYKTHASIDTFCTKYSSRVDKRFLIL